MSFCCNSLRQKRLILKFLKNLAIKSCKFHFFKWANPGLFFISFRIFTHTLQFLQQINVKNCPSNIWCRDSNSRPLDHESPPITARPGLPPSLSFLFAQSLCSQMLIKQLYYIQSVTETNHLGTFTEMFPFAICLIASQEPQRVNSTTKRHSFHSIRL